jgi:hypothetical protein
MAPIRKAETMTPTDLWYIAEWVGILGTIAAIVGGGLAAWKGIVEWKRATLQRTDELTQRKDALKQRKQEFRQKQAVFARDIIKDIFGDRRARNALTMLDFWEDDYEDTNSARFHVTRADLHPALHSFDSEDEVKATFIKRCFESLYDHLEQVENLLEVGVLNIADIDTAFRYYMKNALERDIEHLQFFVDFDYPKAKRFQLRFKP